MCTGKVNAGNSEQRVTPDTQHILVIDITFGLKIHMLRHLPLRYLQTENEVNLQGHWAAVHKLVSKHYLELWKSQAEYV